MIDLTKLKKSNHEVEVAASNRIFIELGNNTYDFRDILSEFIDNSLAARRENQMLKVEIEIHQDSTGIPRAIAIRDNASGIPAEKLGDAISPAAIKTEDSLNEHGLGMKQGVAALGELGYLATKCEGEEKARVITEFRFGSLEVGLSDEFPFETGTEIVVNNLKNIVPVSQSSITTTVLPKLGARYRRFLRPDNPVLMLTFTWKDSQGVVRNTKTVEEVKPVYFHPNTRSNTPVINNYSLRGEAWTAQLTFGYAPDQTELLELGLGNVVNQHHPYNVSLNKAGLDIIMHDRVILFTQLPEIGITQTRHNSYNKLRGEIDLLSGFSTAITKNSIIHDQAFSECIEQVAKILNGKQAGPDGVEKDYIVRPTYLDELPEALIRDRLRKWLENNPLQSRARVSIEYSVEGIEGYVDILADDEAWEIKINQANALDVYQLFMYLDVGRTKKGFLLAPNFSPGALIAAQFVNDNHEVAIQLKPLSDFPVMQAPDANEREAYF